MTTPRLQLVTALAPLLPDVRVIGYGDTTTPDVPAVPTLVVGVESIIPGAVTGYRTYGFDLIVQTPLTSGAAAADALDALVEDVLAVLDYAPEITWSECRRGVHEDRPAYKVNVTVNTLHERPTP